MSVIYQDKSWKYKNYLCEIEYDECDDKIFASQYITCEETGTKHLINPEGLGFNKSSVEEVVDVLIQFKKMFSYGIRSSFIINQQNDGDIPSLLTGEVNNFLKDHYRSSND